MIRLLNNLAWGVSIALGLAMVGGYPGVGWIAGLMIALVIKAVVFPRAGISDRVREYTDRVLRMSGSGGLAAREEPIRERGASAVPVNQTMETIPQSSDGMRISGGVDQQDAMGIHEEMLTDEHVPIDSAERDMRAPAKREPGFIETFFAENLIAKIGGIFIFLGVLFFLGLVYNKVGSVGKLIFGFLAGFACYLSGALIEKKGYKQEGRIMLGVGILINYLVILMGRYLIGDDSNPITGLDTSVRTAAISPKALTEGTTFFFLILNTIFAVVTALVYRSKALLFFSFVVAYFNPLLVGAWPDTPYTTVGYSFIISVGALLLSSIYFRDSADNSDLSMSSIGFMGGNILFLLASMSTPEHFILKLVASMIICLATVFIAYRNGKHHTIGPFLVASYIVFAILLSSASVSNIIQQSSSFFWYMLSLALILGFTTYLIVVGGVVAIGSILFAPLGILLFLALLGKLIFAVPVLLVVVIAYLIIFVLTFEFLGLMIRYMFFIIVGIFLMISNFSLVFVQKIDMTLAMHISVGVTGLTFFVASCIFSKRQKMEFLPAIGSLGAILLFLPIMHTGGPLLGSSIATIVVFSLVNALYPFFYGKIDTDRTRNILVTLVSGILFIAWELYNFMELGKLSPGVAVGYAYVAVAGAYFALGAIMMNRLDFSILSRDDVKSKKDMKNLVFGYLGIALSLFSLAITFIFSKGSFIASTWFFEATILYFFFFRVQDPKVLIAALLLSLIGAWRYAPFIVNLQTGDYPALIGLALVTASFFLNLFFFRDDQSEGRKYHDILHIIGLVMVGSGVSRIVPHLGHGYEYFAIAVFLVVVGSFYRLFSGGQLSGVLAIFLGLYGLFHVFGLSELLRHLSVVESGGSLKLLQYLTIAIPGIGLFFLSRNPLRLEGVKGWLIGEYMVYLFIASTLVVRDLFAQNPFIVTIYWAIWAYFYLSFGISKGWQKWRTIGLYILTLVVLKICLMDIWEGIADNIIRVVALIVVGVLMVYISMLYSKKYPGNILLEFSFSHLFPPQRPGFDNLERKEEAGKEPDLIRTPAEPIVNTKIKDVDTGTSESISFVTPDGKKTTIRSKNLIRIGIMITRQYGKSEFSAGELGDIYRFVIENYRSDLSESDYRKLLTAVKHFVDLGGSVSFR